MQFDLNGKVALVTGGGRGIGKNVSLMLARNGADVALCGRTQETLDKTAAEIREMGRQAWPIVADVREYENIKRFVAKAAETAGHDILVNNAVYSVSAPFDEQSDENWQQHIDVKLMSYNRCVREVLPHMKAQGGGRIVNITE